mmetsp:Transcript_2980/g.5499  ORF Transcript_2980/g.5499 Transcript_2980/m.5499 type:complete len:122 (-) Transcript_2980:251-616(-)
MILQAQFKCRLCIFFCLVLQSWSFSLEPRKVSQVYLMATAADEKETSDIREVSDDVSPPSPEWGASYIGGDPCGSKYNTDPHDAKIQKPGMPSDMKQRIAALAAKKRREQSKQTQKHDEEQ